MRLAVGAMCVAGFAACGSDPAAQFDLDVTVSADRVGITFDFVEVPCRVNQRFPQPGECASRTDGDACTREPTSCLHRARVVRGGVTLGEEAVGELAWFWFGVTAPDVFGSADAELIIEGCGTEARIPLPPAPAPAIVVEEITVTDTDVIVAWSATVTPSGTLAAMRHDRFVGEVCHDAAPGPARLPRPAVLTDETTLAVSAMSNGGVHETPWGVARVWGETVAAVPDPFGP